MCAVWVWILSFFAPLCLHCDWTSINNRSEQEKKKKHTASVHPCGLINRLNLSRTNYQEVALRLPFFVWTKLCNQTWTNNDLLEHQRATLSTEQKGFFLSLISFDSPTYNQPTYPASFTKPSWTLCSGVLHGKKASAFLHLRQGVEECERWEH